MPAELSLYSLNFIDRVLIVRLVGLGDAGLYSLSVKFAQAVNVFVKGFQLAWPPLAYSIQDDDEARRAYAVIVTWFVSVTTFMVAGLWLLSRWIVRALAAPEFFDSYKTIGLVSTGVMLYALYLVLVIVLGRTGRTEFNFPATAAGTLVNIGLNLVLLPSMGIVGAGVSLVASYAVVLVLMYVFTQRLFRVPYEWLRLGQAVGLAALLVAAGELLLPTDGIGGLVGRTTVWLAYPLLLWVTGFLNDEERHAAGQLLSPSAAIARLRALREQPPEEPTEEPPEEPAEKRRGRRPRMTRETIEAEQRDEDAIR
jgi:O-antigen/teichoic acid export membrane protein